MSRDLPVRRYVGAALADRLYLGYSECSTAGLLINSTSPTCWILSIGTPVTRLYACLEWPMMPDHEPWSHCDLPLNSFAALNFSSRIASTLRIGRSVRPPLEQVGVAVP